MIIMCGTEMWSMTKYWLKKVLTKKRSYADLEKTT